MLLVLKRSVSMRRFSWAPTTKCFGREITKWVFDYTLLSESLFMVQIFLYLELNISGHCSVLPEDLYFTHCQRNLDIIPHRLSFLCFSTVNLLKIWAVFFHWTTFTVYFTHGWMITGLNSNAGFWDWLSPCCPIPNFPFHSVSWNKNL